MFDRIIRRVSSCICRYRDEIKVQLSKESEVKKNCLLCLKVNNLGHHQIGLYMQLFSLPLKCCANNLRESQWLMDGTWLLIGANLQDQNAVFVNEPCQCCHVLWYFYNLIMQGNFIHSQS